MKTKVILCICTALIWTLGSQTAKAEIVFQGWQEFAFPVIDDFNCAGEDGVVSGMIHTTITEMVSGYGYHINAEGIVQGNDSGAEYLWRDTIAEVVPIRDDPPHTHFVGTYQQRLRVIGKGGDVVKFILQFKSHATVIGGEWVVYFDDAFFLCKDPQN